MIRETFKDLLRYLPARVIPALVAIAAVPALTRLLPPSEYGRFTLALAASSLFVSLTSAWISTSAIRFVPSYRSDARLGEGVSQLAALFVITLVTCGLAAGLVGGVLTRRSGLSGGFVGIVIALCAVSAIQEFLLGLLRSRRRATSYTVLASFSGALGYALATGMAGFVDRTASMVVTGFLLAVLLVVPLSLRMSLRGIALRIPHMRTEHVSDLLRYGLPALVINGLTWVTAVSDRYILAAAQGASAVGIYSASRDLSDKALVLLNTLFLLSSTPVGMSVWERDGEDAARRYVARLTRFSLLITAPLAMGIAVLARPLISLLADARYHEGFRLVPLVAAGSVFAGLATRYTLGLSFRKRTDLVALCYLGAGAVSVGLNLVLVPRFGYMAAAAGNLTAYAALVFLARSVSRPHFAWPFPTGAALRILAAAAAMGVAVHFAAAAFPHPAMQLAVGVPVGMVTYAAAILAAGGVSAEERAGLARRLAFRRRPRPAPGP